MDAITLLKQGHKTVNASAKYEKRGDRAYVAKRAVVDGDLKDHSLLLLRCRGGDAARASCMSGW